MALEKARCIVRLRQSATLVAVLVVLLPGLMTRGQSAKPAEAIALEQQGKLEEAAAAWRAVTAQNPRDAGAFASLGVVLSKEQKYPEAAAAYKKALALDRKLPGVELNLGLAEFKQGNFEAAIAPFRAALVAQPQNAQARALLGLSWYGAKRFAEAAKQLKVAAKSDPGNTELRRALAQSCLLAKEYECALEEFRQILQQDIGVAVVRRDEALAQIRLHENELVPAAKLGFESALASYQAGKETFESVLSSLRTYASLNIDYFDFLKQQMQAEADIAALRGGARQGAASAAPMEMR